MSCHVLICHPVEAHPPALTLVVEVDWADSGALRLRYRFSGAIDRLRLPAPTAPGAADGLWQHTCCEAFVAGAGAAYHEFNLAPSSRWAAYRFFTYRGRDEAWQPAAAPSIVCRRDGEQFELLAEVPAVLLPAAPRLRLGLTAVVETDDDRKTYWALKHAAARPDFHLDASFVLPLDRP